MHNLSYHRFHAPMPPAVGADAILPGYIQARDRLVNDEKKCRPTDFYASRDWLPLDDIIKRATGGMQSRP